MYTAIGWQVIGKTIKEVIREQNGQCRRVMHSTVWLQEQMIGVEAKVVESFDAAQWDSNGL